MEYIKGQLYIKASNFLKILKESFSWDILILGMKKVYMILRLQPRVHFTLYCTL